MRAVFIGIAIQLAALIPATAQDTSPTEGLRRNPPSVHAFTQATIVVSPDKRIENGTVVIRDGVIESVGESVSIPADARVWDSSGHWIYPGLINAYTEAGQPDDYKDQETYAYWNALIRPERRALEYLDPQAGALSELRKQGFTAAHVVPRDGIFRGQSTVVSLSDQPINQRVLRESVAQILTFDRNGAWTSYPGSLMGSIALARQALYDADWYRRAHSAFAINPNQEPPESNPALEALQPVLSGEIPVLALVDSEKMYLRAQRLQEEFSFNLWASGSGYEYRNPDLYRNLSSSLILGLNFPKKPAIKTYEEALDLSLTALRHWERAPSNPAVLAQADIPFTLSTRGLDNAGEFKKRVRTAIKHGLSHQEALAALTTVPAQLLGIDDQLGTLKPGKRGHLLIADGALFDDESRLLSVWIDGERFAYHQLPALDPRGQWQLTAEQFAQFPQSATLSIQGRLDKLKAKLITDSTSTAIQWIEVDAPHLSFQLAGGAIGREGVWLFSGVIDEEQITGNAATAEGVSFTWQARRLAPHPPDQPNEPEETQAIEYVSRQVQPPSAYGFEDQPFHPESILVTNATIWTSGPQGIVENADLLIRDGKIVKVGKNLEAPQEALRIDGTGKHVTPGLIDAHSHIAIDGGVNEAGQAITAEVRIGDVIDHTDINLYRQLAGGLTMAHVMHGSANPIGGQNQTIKLRWSELPEGMKEKRTPGTIKFALGENVKQSNWGDEYTTRYPQTRMGVEQIIRDRFMAALDYQQAWQSYQKSPNNRRLVPPRRDLELDALLEILQEERWIHCHSYRQDEILMLMRLMERFGVRVGTFQHILEGYKVADEMARHGAAGSSFSDWWAYKFEVYDAIPYNGALMHNQGVITSFNSDNAELARRLNTEAAKAVKYGGVSEEEALKFVTLHPAQQLKVDEFTGSLEPGKDGDFVIWSGHPLSTYAVCEQTWIEGRRYFSLDEDQERQTAVKHERAQLIQKLLGAKDQENDETENGETGEPKGIDEAFWYEQIHHHDQRGLCRQLPNGIQNH